MNDVLNQILSELQQLKVAQEYTNERIHNLEISTNARLEKIEQTMATKEDIETLLAEQQKDILSMLKVTHSQIEEKIDNINEEIIELKESLNKVELITASNWKDITKLKSVK